MVSDRSKPRKKVETTVSGFDSDFGSRLKFVIDRIGTQKRAGEVAGVKSEMIAKYLSGRAKPSFFAIGALAEAAGESLDWLATGRRDAVDAPGTIDETLLSMIIEELERFREERGLYWNPERRARLIALGYAMMLAEREKGQESNLDALRYMLEAAS